MSSRRWIALALVPICVLAMVGCGSRNEDYPGDWPALVRTFSCPDLAGQWRLGGRPGLDMGVLAEPRLLHVHGDTFVAWDVISISFDQNKRMTIRLSRSTSASSDPDALPRSLWHFAARPRDGTVRRSREGQARHYENSLDRDLYHCSGDKLTIEQWTTNGGAGSIFLSKDKKGNLVAGRVERVAESIQLTSESANLPVGHSVHHAWSHWPAITQAESDSVEKAAAAQTAGFDAGPLEIRSVGPHDLEDVRAEATAELEGGAKVIAMRAVGAGSVLATIEGPDEWSIHSALDRVETARLYKPELRRYDPSHDGAYQADVLLIPAR